MEPNIKQWTLEALFILNDAYLTPNLLMKDLIKILEEKGGKKFYGKRNY